MSRKVKSARGEEVDFDLLQVKSNIQKTDKPLDVKTREDFVHLKRRRRGNSKVSQMIANKAAELQQNKEQELEALRKAAATPVSKSSTPVKDVEESETPKKKRQIVKKEKSEDAVDG